MNKYKVEITVKKEFDYMFNSVKEMIIKGFKNNAKEKEGKIIAIIKSNKHILKFEKEILEVLSAINVLDKVYVKIYIKEWVYYKI